MNEILKLVASKYMTETAVDTSDEDHSAFAYWWSEHDYPEEYKEVMRMAFEAGRDDR